MDNEELLLIVINTLKSMNQHALAEGCFDLKEKLSLLSEYKKEAGLRKGTIEELIGSHRHQEKLLEKYRAKADDYFGR